MDTGIATATVKFRLDVNFGDPITPAVRRPTCRTIRPGVAPIPALSHPIESVLAEKLVTAIALGAASTRVRDYADIIPGTRANDLLSMLIRSAMLTSR